ncbi:hypothetical protein FACS189483_00160 [Spirochaetia bacterium]|nr:hypothetical protein FACS189483_00160 [Spirochaetia bacterium]
MPLTQEKHTRPPRPQGSHYTYADYLEWDEDFRAEIINGEVYAMSPPLTVHQRISMNLTVKIGTWLEGKTCELFPAPFGVRLFPKEDYSDDTVLEPDLVVICDSAKIDERGCNGAPDLVIEILSPSNTNRDTLVKLNLYLDAGVREYWIVDPKNQYVQIYTLDQGRYFMTAYGICDPNDPLSRFTQDIAPVGVLPGLTIDLKTIFTG